MIGHNPVMVQVADRGIGNLVGRQAAHKLTLKAVVSQRDGHIGLAATEVGLKA